MSTATANTVIHRKVDAARAGANPQVIRRLYSGWAVLGDNQCFPGYSLLLPDPVVPHLNAMDREARVAFLDDMALLGDAVLRVTGAVRINYEMLGNLEPALHAHVFPRRDDEPEELRTKPPWFSPLNDPAHAFDAARHADMIAKIAAALDDLLRQR